MGNVRRDRERGKERDMNIFINFLERRGKEKEKEGGKRGREKGGRERGEGGCVCVYE